MNIGVWIPCYRAWIRRDEVLALAGAAEKLEFDSLWVQDHLVAPVGGLETARVEQMSRWLPIDEYGDKEYTAVEYYGKENWWLDPYILWGVLAGCTSRIKLASCIIVLPYRDPIVQAKMLGTLDVLSGGRMIFGVGTGHVEAEFSALGIPFKQRGARMDEHIRVIRALLAGDEAEFSGKFTNFPAVKPLISSVQRPHPPIFIGGNSERAVRRAVELGEGWLPTNVSPEDLRGGIKFLSDLASEKKVARPEVGMTLVWGIKDPESNYSGQSLRSFYTVEQAAEIIVNYAKEGVGHLAIDVPNPNLSVTLRQLELLAQAASIARGSISAA